jgi:hypothetical protein
MATVFLLDNITSNFHLDRFTLITFITLTKVQFDVIPLHCKKHVPIKFSQLSRLVVLEAQTRFAIYFRYMNMILKHTFFILKPHYCATKYVSLIDLHGNI